MKKRVIRLVVASVCAVSLLAGCGNSGTDSKKESKGTITVGVGSMTESQLTTELYALALEDAGYTVEREEGMDMAYEALLADEIDLFVSYTGTAYTRYMENEPLYDAEEMTKRVREFYAEEYNIAIPEPSAINNSYGIVMMKDKAKEMGISTFADLQEKADQLVWGDWGFLAMPTTGRARIEELYGPFEFKEVMDISMELSYDILETGDVDVIPVCTTDAKLNNDEYLMLDPEKDVWCEYLLVPFVRQEIFDDYSDVEEIINNVSSKLDNDTIIPLIGKVDIDHEDVHDVAADFYEETFK